MTTDHERLAMIVRERLGGICAAAGVELDALALYVITASSVRLDHPPDRAALRETVACVRPRLHVHHARKGGHARAGQALRGSSELHAWGDSNLYLRRSGERLTMIEHRAAASAGPLELRLRAGPEAALALSLVEADAVAMAPRTPRPTERVLEVLAAAEEPLTRRAIRDACRMRSTSVGDALAEFVANASMLETERGYMLAR